MPNAAVFARTMTRRCLGPEGARKRAAIYCSIVCQRRAAACGHDAIARMRSRTAVFSTAGVGAVAAEPIRPLSFNFNPNRSPRPLLVDRRGGGSSSRAVGVWRRKMTEQRSNPEAEERWTRRAPREARGRDGRRYGQCRRATRGANTRQARWKINAVLDAAWTLTTSGALYCRKGLPTLLSGQLCARARTQKLLLRQANSGASVAQTRHLRFHSSHNSNLLHDTIHDHHHIIGQGIGYVPLPRAQQSSPRP